MTSKLYVGGLSYSTSQNDLEELFANQGTVNSAVVVMDRDTGRSRGFGFVEMSSAKEAETAMDELNGKSFDGRTLTVNEAKERTPRRPAANSGW